METSANRKPVVLVTGSAGLIGGRLVHALREDFQVIGLDLKQPAKLPDETEWFHCDMTDRTSIERALEQVRRDFGNRVASIVHLAAYYNFSGEPSPLYQELTVEGTRSLLQALSTFEVEQFVFSSTLLVMKSAAEGERVNSLSPVDAEWDYPQSKLAAERVIAEERHNIPAVLLRMAGVYDEDGHSLPIAQQISRIYEKQLESYFFPGNKTHGQAFIHLDDLTACIRCAIDRRAQLEPLEVFVIGEEDAMSYEELQDELGILIHGKEWPTIRIPKLAAKAGAWVKGKLASEDDAPFIKPWMIDLADQNYPVDIEQARTKLGWTPAHSLRETLPEIVHRLHRDPPQWYELNGLPFPESLTSRTSAGAT
jgi:nucleoside-diphosphate-sugar epimerase